MTTFESFSSPSTKKFAETLAKKVIARGPKKRGATVLALHGELGAGKTTFTQGFMKGLGVRTRVTSPTFILMRRTALAGKKFKNVFHIDFYRVKRATELKALGIMDIFREPSHLVLVEWPERAPKLIPKGALRINFHHGEKEHERIIKMQ